MRLRATLLAACLGAAFAVAAPAHAASLDASCSFAGALDPLGREVMLLEGSVTGSADIVETGIRCWLMDGAVTLMATSNMCPGAACATAEVSRFPVGSAYTICVTATGAVLGGGTVTLGPDCITADG